MKNLNSPKITNKYCTINSAPKKNKTSKFISTILNRKLHIEHSTKLRVRYGETDQMGYCYYGNYAQYFEVGRVEALRDSGMSYRKLEELGAMLPVLDYQVKYIMPAKYDDELNIITKIVKLDGTRLYFEYEVYNENGKLLTTGTTTLVFISKETKRPTKPPSEFVDLISKHEINN
jgi:acyl-CoA thioester hydrolase